MASVDDIGRQLADAGRALEETSSAVGSSTSEPREQLDEGRRVQDEMERRSDASAGSSRRRSLRQHIASRRPDGQEADHASDSESVASLGTTNSVQAMYREVSPAGSSGGPGSRGSAATDSTVILDKVELAIAEAKRAAIEKAKETASLSGSGSHVGSGASSSLPSGRGIPTILPAVAISGTSPEKKQVIDKVVTTVVEKTGHELAQMQMALEKAREKAALEAKEKAELEAKVAMMKTTAVAKDMLAEALHSTRGAKVQVEEERDDLKDKLVGMQTLMEAKVDRHVKEKEALREKARELEEELKKRTDANQDNMKEELAIAAQEMEKAKKQKSIAAAERDVVQRAELAARKAHEAELQAVKAQVVAAKVELYKHGIAPSDVLPIVEGDEEVIMDEIKSDQGKTTAEKILALKLREQRDNNKKLHQDFERLRMEMLHAHEERDAELAELRAKAEVGATIPKAAPLIGRSTKRHIKQRGQPMKLQCIDEEDDGDVASQAGSGVSGQISSDCDGVGVGDLRDFDDYDVAVAKVRSLKEELAVSESWYKHLDELKQGKDAEYQAKIQRLAHQLQVMREEAMENKDLATKLEIDKYEIELQKQAEVESVKACLLENQVQGVGLAGETHKVQELERKLARYTTHVMELQEELSGSQEAKRILNLRLADMRRELQAMEERHARTVEQLHARLRRHGEDPEASGAGVEVEGDDVMTKTWNLEEERNLLKNELEGQQVHWQAQLEAEQRQGAAALAKLREERELAEKDRELRRKVEDNLAETQRTLNTMRRTLAETESQLGAARAGARTAAPSILDLLRCPVRDRSAPRAQSASHALAGGPSCQGIVWQILSSVGGVAALLCSDEGFVIRDASKKAFAMWGSATLRGSTLFKLIFDEQMSAWLQTELEAPPPTAAFAPGASQCFWLKDLGFVEFRSRLGSAFDASLIIARLPAEPSLGQPPAVVVVVQPAVDETQQMAQDPYAHGRQAPQLRTGRPRRGPASVTSSVHSEDITANDSVSNVNARW